jgi:hypothetical protein
MRVVILAFVGGVVLAAISAQATPLSLKASATELGARATRRAGRA